MSLSRRLAQAILSSRKSFSLPHRTLGVLSHQSLPHARSFAITPRRQASENTELEELYNKLSQTTVYKKLLASPEAIDALQSFAQAMKGLGIDLTKPPSPMQMLKLSMNKEVREAGMRMNTEFAKAGIDLSDKNVLEEVMSAMKR
ncbi:hypothetical protein E1B28_004540 [Marasmius oreades]|uniref:Uncharacterized protein n=1 Tax=Marasmius oreades TaxID=181124 RepID=A0A9P7UYU5_9AGAR|nr:uncharacterized protein E1B28_004540 [Marasmius oreades]KAG7097163.1 hypothetical protein E1B28_004540 [Marasmius oreades]